MESKQKLTQVPNATDVINANHYKVGEPLYLAWMEGVLWCTQFLYKQTDDNEKNS